MCIFGLWRRDGLAKATRKRCDIPSSSVRTEVAGIPGHWSTMGTATGSEVGSEPPYYVKGAALGIPAILVGLQVSAWITFFLFPRVILTRADFRDIYTSAYMVRSGYSHQLYDYDTQKRFQDELVSARSSLLPFDHLPYETLLFVPFAVLPYKSAYFTFMSCNFALLAVLFRVFLPFLSQLRATWFLLPVGIFAGFFPVTITLMLGQDSILMLGLFSFAILLLRRDRELAAGMLVGLGFFKFQMVLPIAFLFLMWRRWRFFAGFSVSAFAVTAISFLMIGLTGMRAYLSLLISMSIKGDQFADQFKSRLGTIAMPNLRGLVSTVTSSHIPGSWAQILTVGLSLLVMLWVAFAAPASRRGPDGLLLAVTAAAVVSYHMLIQDLTVLLIPIAVTLERFIESEETDDEKGRWTLRAATLLLLSPSFVFLLSEYFCLTALPLCFFLFVLMKQPIGRPLFPEFSPPQVDSA